MIYIDYDDATRTTLKITYNKDLAQTLELDDNALTNLVNDLTTDLRRLSAPTQQLLKP